MSSAAYPVFHASRSQCGSRTTAGFGVTVSTRESRFGETQPGESPAAASFSMKESTCAVSASSRRSARATERSTCSEVRTLPCSSQAYQELLIPASSAA
nr:hypothetical protein [Streptomyces sp. A 4/2]